MTQYISADGATMIGHNVDTMKNADAEMPAPFQALDRLSKVGSQIDAILSTLIGQLQPYCVEGTVAESKSSTLPPSGSPLEQRIDREIALLQEIAMRGEELLGRLRL